MPNIYPIHATLNDALEASTLADAVARVEHFEDADSDPIRDGFVVVRGYWDEAPDERDGVLESMADDMSAELGRHCALVVLQHPSR